ncbi:hypothetical protein [Anditalea andensis]|uniref:OmpR/PhoB-type domain-containing protein n=1 Tax=Anditalea andensis TaxID=1048983 RepID=A0A074L2R7_9BACT|nr:hypothetical protein [Anditalea andensis]KEO74128.1 hypothetical protein EL17_08275 [Anditalea andensis]
MEKQEKLESLEKVLSSKTFVRAPSSSVLLKFLVEATLNNKDLKETTISMELFGKNYADEKSDAHIRVNVYHLRKKLDKYYLEEGKDDQWRMHIKKGQYQVTFEERKKDAPTQPKNYNKLIIASTVILLVITGWYVRREERVLLWQPFFSNSKQTTLFIGDFFGIMGTTVTGHHGWNRDYDINNLSDYYQFVEDHPEKKDEVTPANYPYVTGMAANGTMNISRLFHQKNKDFDIQFSSQTTAKDVSKHNSIYIGPIKNKNLFIDFFNDANPNFRIENNFLFYKNSLSGRDTLISLSIDDGSVYEHAIVSRIKGPNDTEQFIFFSDHDIGVKATTEKFSDAGWMKSQLLPQIGNHSYFTGVFLVKGKNRTNFELELLFMEIL